MSVYLRLSENLVNGLAHDGSRADALDLLAADALVTYACQAVAETEPEALRQLGAGPGGPMS